MKIKLIFDSDNEDDMQQYKMMNQASDMYCALDDIRSKLRAAYKHGHAYTSADDAIEKLYDYYFEVMAERGINEN